MANKNGLIESENSQMIASKNINYDFVRSKFATVNSANDKLFSYFPGVFCLRRSIGILFVSLVSFFSCFSSFSCFSFIFHRFLLERASSVLFGIREERTSSSPPMASSFISFKNEETIQSIIHRGIIVLPIEWNSFSDVRFLEQTHGQAKGCGEFVCLCATDVMNRKAMFFN